MVRLILPSSRLFLLWLPGAWVGPVVSHKKKGWATIISTEYIHTYKPKMYHSLLFDGSHGGTAVSFFSVTSNLSADSFVSKSFRARCNQIFMFILELEREREREGRISPFFSFRASRWLQESDRRYITTCLYDVLVPP